MSTAPQGESLTAEDLIALMRQVFALRPDDRRIAILVDLPDAASDSDQKWADDSAWKETRATAFSWYRLLTEHTTELGLAVDLYAYPNVGTNNGDLPSSVWLCDPSSPPRLAADLDALTAQSFATVFGSHQIILALTRFSATAPLKLAAPLHGFRAATMPGFRAAMIPALRVDYRAVQRRVDELKGLLDRARGAELVFRTGGARRELYLDLRHRKAHASGGLLPEPGTAGNLPSGEAYIVPYEGELVDDPSLTQGMLPVELEDEIVLYRVVENRAVEVTSVGPISAREKSRLESEPAYGNLAELGLGVLADFGVEPIGEILVDEKLGLHIAFGRSDHFGGATGYPQFNDVDRVVHIDRVYLESTQPLVRVRSLNLVFADGSRFELMREGRYTYRPSSAV